MQWEELKGEHFQRYYLFNPEPYGRIFVFVDFANVRQWAKLFWPEENRDYLTREIDIAKLADIIDYVKPVKKFFYYGIYAQHDDLPEQHPHNRKHRQSMHRLIKARDHGFNVRMKEIKEISLYDAEGRLSGRINKCNFDVEIAMDVLNRIDQYDTIFLWSGDSDFHLLMQYAISRGKKVITICARDFVSRELHDHSTLYLPADPLKDHLEYVKQSTPGSLRGA